MGVAEDVVEAVNTVEPADAAELAVAAEPVDAAEQAGAVDVAEPVGTAESADPAAVRLVPTCPVAASLAVHLARCHGGDFALTRVLVRWFVTEGEAARRYCPMMRRW